MEHFFEVDKKKNYGKRGIEMVVDLSFDIILNSQLGPKFGTLVLKKDRNKALATFTFIGHENILKGRIMEDILELKGKIMTPLGPRHCFAAGVLAGDEIQAEITIGAKCYQITGKKHKQTVEKRGEDNEV